MSLLRRFRLCSITSVFEAVFSFITSMFEALLSFKPQCLSLYYVLLPQRLRLYCITSHFVFSFKPQGLRL